MFLVKCFSIVGKFLPLQAEVWGFGCTFCFKLSIKSFEVLWKSINKYGSQRRTHIFRGKTVYFSVNLAYFGLLKTLLYLQNLLNLKKTSELIGMMKKQKKDRKMGGGGSK